MRKKYLNIILIILLVFIWGGVIYKYFGKSVIIDTSLRGDVKNSLQQPKFKTTKDTFQLQLINKNPFKTTKTRKVNYTKISEKVKRFVKVKSKPNNTFKWPKITYHGFVKGNKNNTRLILLKIDNKLYRKREQETVKGVKLIKVYNDSLQVLFQNNIKYIEKIHD